MINFLFLLLQSTCTVKSRLPLILLIFDSMYVTKWGKFHLFFTFDNNLFCIRDLTVYKIKFSSSISRFFFHCDDTNCNVLHIDFNDKNNSFENAKNEYIIFQANNIQKNIIFYVVYMVD